MVGKFLPGVSLVQKPNGSAGKRSKQHLGMVVEEEGGQIGWLGKTLGRGDVEAETQMP